MASGLRVLVLARNYPNSVMQVLGLWTRSVAREMANRCAVKVVSPVPYCPPFPGIPEQYARFNRIDRVEVDGAIESIHPRMIVGPGTSTFSLESVLYMRAVRSAVRDLRRAFPFDLIHAEFTYPDGVVAIQLGKIYNVPVVVREHNPWVPWITRYPRVRRLAVETVRQAARHVSVSEAVRNTVRQFAPGAPNLTVIPNGIDPSEFPLDRRALRDPAQLLFVGAIRPVKGVDVLLKAVRLLVSNGRPVRLLLVGEAFYPRYAREEDRLKQMVGELGIGEHVRFVGKQLPPTLGETMRRSAALVLPSRAEAFGAVLVEALMSGTPVVATRCGGPEEIVDERVGVLVPTEDPDALARGIAHVLDHPAMFDPAHLRAHALARFALESVGERLKGVYDDVVARHGIATTAVAPDLLEPGRGAPAGRAY